ncbi:hypothetical protein NE236_14235 [Actinoallomurus purpureus]|uniref:hypothetical protein n=1 Tax=Actinoallomurus purpureus TaxID=478114 RepID=UPI0020935E72|nr:hypothetical protein [Actinoallomurus purpureus]MCO6006149.1 hypothetical protein [Actinoallomurus purpureus]
MAKDPFFDEGHAAAAPDPVAGAPTSAPDGSGPDLTVTHTSERAHAVKPPESSRTEEVEGTLTRELRPTRVVPRWVGWLVIAAGVAMLPWITGLSFVLPTSHETAHYNASWIGFDLGLCAMLLRTGWLAQKGREHIELSAAMTGTLLLVDAWFDVVTADSRGELMLALALALFGELPLAAFFLWIAGRVEFRRQRRAAALARLLRRLRRRRSAAARARSAGT